MLREIGDASLSPFPFSQRENSIKFDHGMLRGASTWVFETPENSYEVTVSYTGGKSIFPGSNIGIPKFMTYDSHLDTTQEGKPLKIMATITAVLKKEFLQDFEGKPVIEYLDYIIWPASEEKFGSHNIHSKTQRNKLYKIFLQKQLPQYIDSWVDVDGYFGFKVKKDLQEIKINKPGVLTLRGNIVTTNMFKITKPVEFMIQVYGNDLEFIKRTVPFDDFSSFKKLLDDNKIPYENTGKLFTIKDYKKYIRLAGDIDEIKINKPVSKITNIRNKVGDSYYSFPTGPGGDIWWFYIKGKQAVIYISTQEDLDNISSFLKTKNIPYKHERDVLIDIGYFDLKNVKRDPPIGEIKIQLPVAILKGKFSYGNNETYFISSYKNSDDVFFNIEGDDLLFTITFGNNTVAFLDRNKIPYENAGIGLYTVRNYKKYLNLVSDKK